MFQYHTFLHHSQTVVHSWITLYRFSTIRFYIILKQHFLISNHPLCFSTIRFYIILKQLRQTYHSESCFSTIRFYIILKLIYKSVCFYLRFSTIRFYIILKPGMYGSRCDSVSVPYVFTSFSNTTEKMSVKCIVSVPYVFTSFSNAP